MKPSVTGPFISGNHAISRRRFLRGAGILMALPLLDAMRPVSGALAAASAASETPGGRPRRMLAICNNLGLLPDQFFPKQTGRDYPLSPYLEILQEHRDDFTVFSGVSHPDVDGGHPADNCFLTAAPHPGRGSFRNTISLDQYIGERIGHLTRFPSLTLGVNVQQGQRSLSWTSSGVLIPCEEKAADVFRRLFLRGTQEEMDRQVNGVLNWGKAFSTPWLARRKTCNGTLAHAIVIDSTSISRACAILSNEWPCPANGNTNLNRL